MEDIHHSHFVAETDDKVETARVKGEGFCVFLKCRVDVKFEFKIWGRCVRPDLDSAIRRASSDKLFFNTDIHAFNGTGMEGIDEVLVVHVVIWSVYADRHLDNLLFACGENQHVHIFRKSQRLNSRLDALTQEVARIFICDSTHGGVSCN